MPWNPTNQQIAYKGRGIFKDIFSNKQCALYVVKYGNYLIFMQIYLVKSS